MNRGNNAGISSAAADIPAHVFRNLIIRRGGVAAEQSVGRHDHTWSAVPALKSFFVEKRLLYGVQAAILREGFNGLDFFTGCRGRCCATRADRTAIEQHCACSTLAFAAAVLCAGQSQTVAQDGKERFFRPGCNSVFASVYEKSNFRHSCSGQLAREERYSQFTARRGEMLRPKRSCSGGNRVAEDEGLPFVAIASGRAGHDSSVVRGPVKRRAYGPHVLGMVGTESQLDDRARIRGDLGLPSVISLITGHGLLRARVPLAGGRAVKIFFADQRLLNFGGAVVFDFLLAMALPCSTPCVSGRSLVGRLGCVPGRGMFSSASLGRAQASQKKENYADV